MKFIVQSCFELFEIEKACNNSWNLCFTNLTRWQVEHESTYFLTFLFMLFSKYFFFNKFSVFSCSKWSAYESSWFCFRSFLLSKFERIYHLFSQRNKSFSIFHLKEKSKSIFLRIIFDSTSSRLIESWRSTLSFFFFMFYRCFLEKKKYKQRQTKKIFENKKKK